jgi:hypothetical protein
MREIKRYQCEICGSEYDTPEFATVCESSGLPAPMPFLPWDREIPCFGENNIRHARLIAVEVGCAVGDWYTLQMIQSDAAKGKCHTWRVNTIPWIWASHNLNDDVQLPARAFDPRQGVDAFRHFGTVHDLETWERAMRDYGLNEEDAGDCVMKGVRRMRALREDSR